MFFFIYQIFSQLFFADPENLTFQTMFIIKGAATICFASHLQLTQLMRHILHVVTTLIFSATSNSEGAVQSYGKL